MSGLRADHVPGRGVLITDSGGTALDPQVRRAVRAVGGRRHGAGLLLPLEVAGDVLRDVPVTWDPTARRAVDNRSRLARVRAGVLTAARAIAEAGPDVARGQLADCGLLKLLDDHQAVNVARMTLPDGWGACVFDEQGTGKTVSTVATYDTLAARGEAQRLLIVAPKSMVGEWGAEFAKFAGDLYQVATVQGTRAQKLAALRGREDVVVLNYETATSMLDELVLLARRSRTVLVVDESYNVKNPDAGRTVALAGLREWCTRAYVLCGTPAPNASHDVISQASLVDHGAAFAGLELDPDPDIARAQVQTVLDRDTVYTRNLKQTVLPDLPGRTFSEVMVDLAPGQRALYDDAAGHLVDDLKSVTDAQFARTRAAFVNRGSSLLRICSDPDPAPVAGQDGGVDGEVPGKVAALDGILRRLVVEQGEKVVLWSYYRRTLDRLADRYAHLGLVRIDGSVTDNDERRSAVRRFQDDPGTRVFLGNPAAAGAGVTLHAARYAVYESLGAQAAHHMQSLDRIHRRGQDREVHYITLLARDTVEEVHYRRLLTKAEAQAQLLGDPAQEHPTRQMMLADLTRSWGST